MKKFLLEEFVFLQCYVGWQPRTILFLLDLESSNVSLSDACCGGGRLVARQPWNGNSADCSESVRTVDNTILVLSMASGASSAASLPALVTCLWYVASDVKSSLLGSS